MKRANYLCSFAPKAPKKTTLWGKPSPRGLSFGAGADVVDAQVGPFKFFFRAQSQAHRHFESAIHHGASHQSPHHAQQGAQDLGLPTHTAQTAKIMFKDWSTPNGSGFKKPM